MEARGKVEGLPKWAREHLNGYEFARMEYLREHVLVYGYVLDNDDIVSSWKSREDFYENLGYSISETYNRAIMTGHFWPVDGGLKVYSTYYKDELVPPYSDDPYEEPVYEIVTTNRDGSEIAPTVVESGLLFDVALKRCCNTNGHARPTERDGGGDRYAYIRLMSGHPSRLDIGGGKTHAT